MVCVFLAAGFEEIEALTVVDVLRRADLEVRTVGVGGRQVTGSHGIPVVADLEEQSLDFNRVEMVVLPGGMPGAANLEKSPVVTGCLRDCSARGGWIAAICAAPSVLGHLGLLQGKKATCFPGYEGELAGAQVAAGPVCTDGRLITGNGPGAAMAFALEIVRLQKGEALAEELRRGMQCV